MTFQIVKNPMNEKYDMTPFNRPGAYLVMGQMFCNSDEEAIILAARTQGRLEALPRLANSIHYQKRALNAWLKEHAHEYKIVVQVSA